MANYVNGLMADPLARQNTLYAPATQPNGLRKYGLAGLGIGLGGAAATQGQ